VGTGLVAGVPMHHLKGRVVSLDDLFGSLAGLLREELLEAPGWRERFAIVDRFLIRRIADAQLPSPTLGWALSRLHGTRGAIEIGALTDEIGCSRRYLIGLSTTTSACRRSCSRASFASSTRSSSPTGARSAGLRSRSAAATTTRRT
jgi:hypothetical protein